MSEGIGGNEDGKLKAFVERIDRLEDDKKAIAVDISSIYDEAKSEGYNTKVLRKLVSLHRQDKAKREEEAALLSLYANAIQLDLGI
jgi:uncharacterized protein (UPF0335 family)